MCVNCNLTKAPTRRGVMAGAAALLAASAFPFPASRAETPARNAIPPAEALDLLKQGHARYAAHDFNERDYFSDRASLAQAQYPIAAVLACADSRVPPEIIFDQGPGDLFVVRVAGNFVNDDGLASFEYAVRFLGAPLLLVLGHSNCGAVDAAIKTVKEHAELPGYLPEMIKAIEPAVIAAHGQHPSDLLPVAIEENVRLNMKRLMEDSEILSEALAAKTIAVSGGVYDLATGQVKLI
jgi:carbonic anhydrase